MANIIICLTGQMTVPWPSIHVHALRSMRYHSILVLYCFQLSYMLPGLLPGSMRLIISCSYRAADNVLNVDSLVLSFGKFPDHFLGAFAKLRRAAVSFISVRLFARLSIHPHWTTRLPLDGFEWNLRIFRKYVEKIQAQLYNKIYFYTSALPFY